jgi:putative DNA primase/helicase
MTKEQLETKYARIPIEIKKTHRWVGYKIEMRNGKETKVPYNAISGMYAKSNDSATWTYFDVAVSGCIKYKFDGIGFMLGMDNNTGVNYFGIDLDNHPEADGTKPMSNDEFKDFCKEFIDKLQSYTEYSHSGEGIHIICKGTLPEGARRRNGSGVEMYERGRFFTMTGNVIVPSTINDRTEEVKELWQKYLYTEPVKPVVTNSNNPFVFGDNVRTVTTEIKHTNIADDELLSKIRSSTSGTEFVSLYNGNTSGYANDHSSADLALCKILAFWTGCDKQQIDRIFRSSGLMRDKWDQRRAATTRRGVSLSEGTYGSQTIEYAVANQIDTYTPPKEKIVSVVKEEKKTQEEIKAGVIEPNTEMVEFDAKNDPVIKVKTVFKHYSFTDTGNAERFYDYFGNFFRFNKDNKVYMFWNGKTWKTDTTDIVRKYANKIIEVLHSEHFHTKKEIEELSKTENADQLKLNDLIETEKAQTKNITRVSNKQGKDAMLYELQSLHEIPVKNEQFDRQEWLLNTDSGVVDLRTGDIKPHDKSFMLSKNTNCKVSFDEPKVFMKFIHDLFERKNEEETESIISVVQLLLGESLTGRTNKDHLAILYGHGSNGKSTFISTVNDIFGEYGTSMNSDMLVQKPNSSSQANEFSLSALRGARLVSTSETAEGKKLDEVVIKQMLSGEKINAQEKYGKPYSFRPTFSPWMSTNNKPIIRATDFGTWRRIIFIPFLNTFTGDKKDVNMPKKLAAEYPQILGWMIKGAVKLHKEYNDIIPKVKCLEEALADYKKELDVVAAFLNDRCIPVKDVEISATTLYEEYKKWARQNEEYLKSERKFREDVKKSGYQLKKDMNRGWIYIGLRLAEDKTQGFKFGEE